MIKLLGTNDTIFWLELQLRLQRLLPLLYQCQVIDIHGISQGLELFVLPTIASLLIALLQSLPSSLTKLEILQLWTGDQTGEISRQIVGDIEEERRSGQTFQTAFFPWGGLICCRDQHGSPLMAGCSFEVGEVFQPFCAYLVTPCFSMLTKQACAH